jgi:hypothetical protein
MPAGLPGCKSVGCYQGAVEGKEVYDSIGLKIEQNDGKRLDIIFIARLKNMSRP